MTPHTKASPACALLIALLLSSPVAARGDRPPPWRPLGREPARSVLDSASRYLGRGDPTRSGQPWCMNFVNFVLSGLGYRHVRSGLASDARRLGPPTSAHPGAVAYNSRHAGFVLRVGASTVTLLSGNNSRGVVGESTFALSAYRYVEPARD